MEITFTEAEHEFLNQLMDILETETPLTTAEVLKCLSFLQMQIAHTVSMDVEGVVLQ